MKQINNKSRMSVCLKAIKDYVDLDEAKVSKEERRTKSHQSQGQACGPLPRIS